MHFVSYLVIQVVSSLACHITLWFERRRRKRRSYTWREPTI